MQANPFVEAGADADKLHVMFSWRTYPTAPQVEALDPDRSPGDELAVHGS